MIKNKPKLGEKHDVISVSTSADLQTHIVNMVSQATNNIKMLSRKMDARLTNNSDFIEVLRSCIVYNPNFNLKILIYNLEEFLSQHHQILDLSQRLSSNITIRVLNKEQQHHNNDIILVDNAGVIFREHSDRYESTIEYHNKSKNLNFTRQFNEFWEHGVRDNNLYRLGI
ncbi:hypothetical protein MNBD_GAMMA22-1851 [hydrothermal vent metagenome]|uniref:DUF7931 domain-containing protein n=1 Tax=hydrothermal vent metagenome TaxID=652676 RepID=A0A3B1ASQ3_9ZZZZ